MLWKEILGIWWDKVGICLFKNNLIYLGTKMSLRNATILIGATWCILWLSLKSKKQTLHCPFWMMLGLFIFILTTELLWNLYASAEAILPTAKPGHAFSSPISKNSPDLHKVDPGLHHMMLYSLLQAGNFKILDHSRRWFRSFLTTKTIYLLYEW